MVRDSSAGGAVAAAHQEPSPSEVDGAGRGVDGRFTSGNAFGRGNPHAAKVQRLRAVLLDAVTPEDMRAVVQALVGQAKDGDVAAIRELFDRIGGKALVQEERVQLELPSVHEAADLLKVSEALLQAVARGDVSLDHATRLAGVLEAHRRMVETEELAARIAALERKGA